MEPAKFVPKTQAQTVPATTLVTVTDRAAQELKAALTNEKQTYAGVRLGVQGGGCCGPGYVLALADKVETNDIVVDAAGLKIIVDPAESEVLKGAKIDFVDTPQGSGFHIDNPNKLPESEHEHGGGGCACGSGGGGCGCGSGGGHGGHGGCGC